MIDREVRIVVVLPDSADAIVVPAESLLERFSEGKAASGGPGPVSAVIALLLIQFDGTKTFLPKDRVYRFDCLGLILHVISLDAPSRSMSWTQKTICASPALPRHCLRR